MEEEAAPFNTPVKRHSPTANVKNPEFSQVEVGRSIRDGTIQDIMLIFITLPVVDWRLRRQYCIRDSADKATI